MISSDDDNVNKSDQNNVSTSFSKQNTSAELDPESFKRLNEVRKDIVKGSIKGLAVGTAVGGLAHYGIEKYLIKSGYTKRISEALTLQFPGWHFPHAFPKFSFLPAIFLSGAVGSFITSAVAGRKSINNVGDIFQEGAKPKSEYQAQMQQSQKKLRTEQNDAFVRREASIKEGKRIREEEAKWSAPKS
jgi:hypothetical protein